MTKKIREHPGPYKDGEHVNGITLIADVRRFLYKEEFETVFDVGANVGQTTYQMRHDFPLARIYSFEPIPENFLELSRAVSGMSNVCIYNIGLSSSTGEAAFVTLGRSTGFRISNTGNGVVAKIETVNRFCQIHDISEISLLKVDTEGHDLEVLRGAEPMLESGLVNVVLTECSMNPNNETHVLFSEVYNYLHGFGFALFGFYDQIREWPTREPNLRRCNVAFISSRVVRRNRFSVALTRRINSL